MVRRLLLIDYENIRNFDFSRLGEDVDVVIFVGAGQKSIPLELVVNAQPLGRRVQWQRCEARGKNAVDFEIACHLGGVLEKATKPACFVLSNDKDFDAPSASLTKKGLKCKRITTLAELEYKAPPADDTGYKRVVEALRKSDKKALPKSRKTLAKHVRAMFQNKITEAEAGRLIDRLIGDRRVCESNDAITYTL